MKRSVIFSLLLMMSISFALAETACDLDVSLLNQDPYPAVPGDYVKLVFQVEGLDSPNCNDITFDLTEDYPIKFNPGETGERSFKKIDYIKDYESNLLIPYEVRIHKDALDGANPVEITVQSKSNAPITKTFNIEVEDIKAKFEVYVKDYNYQTNEITFEILNIASIDVEALALEIPKQNSITIKGPNRVIVGDLDSNEYTTADFEAIPSDGEFKINLIYSDTINTRRTAEKTVSFDSSYFTNRKADQTTTGTGTYVFYAIVVLLVGWWIARKFSKKKK
ncbi:MAG TPA: hypothetical protein ENH20_01065 [Candidatus Pacearchaeota archaeon]|nr:hypothetical protein [Candidatus Pacearchaeota archaeon]